MVRGAAVLCAAVAFTAAAAAEDCVSLPVDVAQTAPTSATLSWQARAGAAGYFVTYSTGKFPTQLEIAAQPEGQPVEAVLKDLRPGRSYEIEICEATSAGRCPGPDACTTTVTVAAITAAPDTARPDATHAQCSIQPGVGLQGEAIGYPFEEPVEASSVEACCELCAGTEPRLPYLKQCTAFVFYAESQSCGLLSGWTASFAYDGRTSGLVTGWPAAR